MSGHGTVDLAGTGLNQGQGRGLERGPRGQHVVDDQHPLAAEEAPRLKNGTATSLLEVATGLRGTGPVPQEATARLLQLARQVSGQEFRLVKAPLAPAAIARGRPGHHVELLVSNQWSHGPGQPGHCPTLVAVLDPGHQVSGRAFVAEKRHATAEPLGHRDVTAAS